MTGCGEGGGQQDGGDAVADGGKLGWDFQVSIRSTGDVMLELDRAVAGLRASKSPNKLMVSGRKITKEGVVNSLVLWLASQSIEEAERALAGPVARLDAILGGPEVADPGAGGGGDEDAGSVGEPIDLPDPGPSPRPPRDQRKKRG